MNRILLIICLALPWAASTAASDAELRRLKAELDQTRSELDALREKVEKMGDPLASLAPKVAFSTGPRPMIGVVLGAGPDGSGVQLNAVTPDGPADKAGLVAGDRVLAINDEPLTGSRAVKKAYDLLDGLEVGERFDFDIQRGGERKRVEVTADLVEPAMSFSFSGPGFAAPGEDFAFRWSPEDQAIDLDGFRSWAQRSRDWAVIANSMRPLPDLTAVAPRVWGVGLNWAGLELAALNPGLGRYFGTEDGVLVIDASLEDDSLKAGDVIRSVEGTSVKKPSQVLQVLRDFQPGDPVEFEVLRDGQVLSLSVETPRSPVSGFFYQFGDESLDEG